MSVGSVQAKVASPRAARTRSIAERSSTMCAARMRVLRVVRGPLLNVKGVSVTVRLAVAVLPAASRATAVSKFVLIRRTSPPAVQFVVPLAVPIKGLLD